MPVRVFANVTFTYESITSALDSRDLFVNAFVVLINQLDKSVSKTINLPLDLYLA